MTTRDEQEAMDGSRATVVRTLRDLEVRGKFAGVPIDGALEAFGITTKTDMLEVPVILLHFQCGPIGEVGVNGCAIEDVIDVLVERLEGFQRGPFRCAENAQAMVALTQAKMQLEWRTRARQAQGVEGTNQAHLTKEENV